MEETQLNYAWQTKNRYKEVLSHNNGIQSYPIKYFTKCIIHLQNEMLQNIVIATTLNGCKGFSINLWTIRISMAASQSEYSC